MRRFLLTVILALVCGAASAAEPDSPFRDAKWISKEQSNGGTNSWLGFRRHLVIDEVPATMIANIATDTKYWMWINGGLVVYEGGLKRGPTPLDSYYDSIDIAPYLHEGDNLIAILTWHLGKNGFSHIDSGLSALLFEASGQDVSLVSDEKWECSVLHGYMTADTPAPNYRLPESSVRFDARRYPFDWFKGETPENMGSPMVLPFTPDGSPMGKLVKRPIPFWKDYGVREYESVETRGDTLVCRLPFNCHISPRLKVNAPEGCVITMETDHDVITGSDCLRAQYVTREGVQEYEHLCWLNGEYVRYIVPRGVKVLGVSYRETGYDTEFSGGFSCDDPLLDSYAQKAVRTLYVCMRDTYYDCPDRERAQWWGDEVNELGEAFCLLSPSSHKLALKGIYELMNWQKPSGELFSPVPASNWFKELPFQMLASVGWYGFYTFWQESGDDSFIAPIYDRLHRYLHEVWTVDGDGLPLYRSGGWNWPDAGDNCDAEALLHPWYYLALKAEREFALHLGKAADAAQDEAMMKRIADSFNRKYWNGRCYRSETYDGLDDDRVCAMAVVSGLASAEKYPAITEILRKELHSTTYMHRYALEALCMMGHPEYAQERMRTQYPTIMTDECSTLWEHWNYDGTCNHAWAGCGTIVMSKYFAGIKPTSEAYRTFEVRPMMGSLKHVEAKVDSVSGLIAVTLDRKGRRISMKLSVPEGTTATVPVNGRDRNFPAGEYNLTIK